MIITDAASFGEALKEAAEELDRGGFRGVREIADKILHIRWL